MTLKELSQLYYLRKEIAAHEERLKELRELATSAPIQVISDMPASPHDGESRVERYVVAIAELEELIRGKLEACIEERIRLERFIESIPDSRLRLIFTLRFERCMTWTAVAWRMGRGETIDGVKHACYRYLETSEEEEST